MQVEPIRIIIDSNLWVSFLISRKDNYLKKLLTDERFLILFSDQLFLELEDVLNRPKFRKVFGHNRIESFLSILRLHVNTIVTFSKVNICRDPDDDFLFDLAKDGKADYLITGDNDLLVIERFLQCRVIKLNEFQKLIESE